MPTCYAARGDSCTTEIPKLVQNNPEITKINPDTCSEGKKNDAMLLPSHILPVGVKAAVAKENSSERKSPIDQYHPADLLRPPL